MATITYQIASCSNNLVILEIDVNDVNLRVQQARCINSSPYPATVIVKKNGSIVAEHLCPANQITTRNLPSNIQFSMDSGDPEWGIPPAMTMADIEIGMRWSA